MGNYKIIVSNDDLNELHKNIVQYKDEFIDVLDKIKEMTIELEKYYNTPVGNVIRELIIEYIDKKSIYVSERYSSLGNVLNNITKYYGELYSDISKMVKNQ